MKTVICFFMFFVFSAQVANAETYFRFSCSVLNSHNEIPKQFTISEDESGQKTFVRFMGNSPLSGAAKKKEALQTLFYENDRV